MKLRKSGKHYKIIDENNQIVGQMFREYNPIIGLSGKKPNFDWVVLNELSETATCFDSFNEAKRYVSGV